MKRKDWNSYLITFQRDGTLKNQFCKEVIRDNDTPTKAVFHVSIGTRCIDPGIVCSPVLLQHGCGKPHCWAMFASQRVN